VAILVAIGIANLMFKNKFEGWISLVIGCAIFAVSIFLLFYLKNKEDKK